MKISFSHKNSRKTPVLTGVGILAVLTIIMLFTACDIGLGQIVNTEKPVINTAGDTPPGSYLQGTNNKIPLDVSNKLGFKIVEVWMDVDYTDLNGDPQKKRIDAQQDPDTGEWFVILDTTGMADRKITGTVTAIDESGNKTTTTPMVYNVKNSPPQIKLNMPLVDGDNWDNLPVEDGIGFLDSLKARDPLLLGFELIGLATDNYGIAEGYPKIMIWPADEKENGIKFLVDDDGVPLPPSEGGSKRHGAEYSLVVPNARSGLTATKFSWPMQKLVETSPGSGVYRLPKDNEPRNYLSTGVYRIRIITKDLFGNVNEYPNRKDTKRPTDNPSKKYIEINYIASEIPISQVTTIPQFYNAASDFNVTFIVSCTKELAEINPVEAYITDGNDNENVLGGPYPVIQHHSNGSPYNFTLTIPAAQAQQWDNPKEGTLYLRLRAKAKGDINYGPPIYQYFQYDITPPKVPIDRPVPLSNIREEGKLNGGSYAIYYPDTKTPKWVTETVTVGGINTDDNGIKDVYYHIGKLGDDASPAAYWSEHYNDNYDEVKNTTGVWKDAKLNTTKPDKGWGGSVIGWNYTASFPIGYKNTGSNSDLVQEFNEIKAYYTSTENSDTTDLERFYLPFYIKVVDNAGNFHIVHYKLCVDPLLDEPQVTITSPDEGAQVGGTVLLSGYATDNYWMHTVLIRVKKENGVYPEGTNHDGAYYLPPDASSFYTSNPSFPKPFKPGGVIPDTQGWFKAAKTGDNTVVNWSASINGDKKLDPPDDTLENVTIEVIAIDTNEISHQTPHIVGPIATRNVKFSSKVPNIENEKITKDGVDNHVDLLPAGTKSSGKFYISMDISAVGNLHAGGGFYNVSARINNASSVIDIIKNGRINSGTTWSITAPAQNGDRVNSKLTFTVDTISGGLISPIPYGSTGSMTLELTVEDTTTPDHFRTTRTWVISIDNFYPTADVKTSKIASGNFLVEGTAQDWAAGSGDIQGLERVLVYIEKARIERSGLSRSVFGSGDYLRPNGTTADNPDEWTTYPNVINRASGYTGNEPNVPSFQNFPKLKQETIETKLVWTSKVAMVIDYAENAPTEDYDKDGTKGEMWNGLLDKSWGARLDTPIKFSDGPYMVHYIVMDQAGNATHYTKDIFIENNKPVIKTINIGTDIDFNGTIENWTSQDNPGEFKQNAYIINMNSSNYNGSETVEPSEFKIHNSRFGIRLELEGGNGQKHGVVSYVDNSSTVPATAMQRGFVYEIATNAQSTDFTKYGAPNNYIGTVFIASGEGEGTATVKAFSTVGSFRSEYDNLGIGNVTQTITFDRFLIPPSATINDGDEVKFIVKVYDSALSESSHGTKDEYDQLASVFLLKVAVDNIDTVPPTINVADFGQKYITPVGLNATDDSKKQLTALADAVYSDYVETNASGDKLGYVQYQAHSQLPDPTTRANISGKVIFNGKAADNHRINKITVQIPGYNSDNELTIAERNITSGQLEPVNTLSGGEFRIVYPQVKQYSLEYGHALTWQFMWDSSKVANSTASNINITFRVYDVNSTTATATTSIKNVNIVPYITEITTPLSGAYASNPSAFSRSALGGYPVREGDSITIKGFNFNDVTVKLNGISIGGDVSNNGTTITSTIPTTATNTAVSGPLVVTVNNVDSFNNKSNKTASYNQEPNNVNNNILDNSRYLYVWRTGYLLDQQVITNPFFRMDPKTAARYITFGYYGTQGEMHIQINNGDGRAWNNTTTRGLQLNSVQNRYISTTVAIGSSGEFYAAASNQTQGNHPFSLYVANRPYANMTNGNAAPTVTVRRLVVPSDPGRIPIPRIYARDTTDTSGVPRILMCYYDSFTTNLSAKKNVVLRYGTRDARDSANINGAFANLNSDTTAAVSANGQTVSTATYSGGIYTAVGALYNGRPVLAWYDETHNNLVLAKGNAAIATFSNSVTFEYYIINNPDGTSGAGNYKGGHVDLAVDADDNVHLAFYDVANGGLYYLLIPATGNQADRDLTTNNLTPVRVDTYLAVGTKLMLNVRKDGDNFVPYITYFHGSFAETRNSIRVAWQKRFPAVNGTDASDRFTGAWEVMTVPAQNTPVSGEMICNGVPTGVTNWQNTELTIGTTPDVNLTKSIVVGYMTNSNYEGAILKDDMTSGLPAK